MSWRDNLQPGSFNGAAFHVQRHTESGGRRQLVHQYPRRDDPYTEDRGRQADKFTIDAFVLASSIIGGSRGDDYFTAREALRRELRKKGPGILVHPYLGQKRVAVETYELSESTDEGGLARFTITFAEAGDRLYPSAKADTAFGVRAACDEAGAACEADFAERFRVVKVPAYVSESATAKLEDFISGVRKQASNVAAVGAQITSFSAQLDRLGSSLVSLIRAPADLASDVRGVMIAMRGVVTSSRVALDRYRSQFGFGATDTIGPQTTDTRQLEESNRDALNALVQRAAVIEAARAASDVEFASYEEATTIRDAIATKLDELMEAADDAVYYAMSNLRAATVRDITTRGADLARIVSYTSRTTLPALVIAHHLYGDASRDAEIISRNPIRHPGFVSGGNAIEVLADV